MRLLDDVGKSGSTTECQDGSGRPRATTERKDRAIVRTAVAAPTLSTIQRVTGTQVSKMTINRRLRERNLRSRRPLRCLPLTSVHRHVRLQWCRERSTWNCANWGHMVFSDNSHFLLCSHDCRKPVWRCPGQRVDCALTFKHHTGPQQSSSANIYPRPGLEFVYRRRYVAPPCFLLLPCLSSARVGLRGRVSQTCSETHVQRTNRDHVYRRSPLHLYAYKERGPLPGRNTQVLLRYNCRSLPTLLLERVYGQR
ncbi:hypothetical protein LAZ67_11003736 [Cordylochernes scorpioides]|uniref:Transposase Tc1-like domain-containing protein n=1 Tax=Cordylochernes scorpioides TaxID=51811 RepID=A0ABY6L415_9ARAC|nr:hypothetical protein LAZ67_11003736 [Cordylochernes scorpioides]